MNHPSLTSPPLTYAMLDDYGLASVGAAPPLPAFSPGDLGPQLELLLLVEQGALAAAIPTALMTSARANSPNQLLPLGPHCAVLRLAEAPLADTEWTRLSIEAKRAAVAAGFPDRVAGQLAVAVEEVASNILEHSQAPETGVIAYRGTPGLFEFVAADRGIGALASLQGNPIYARLKSAREALPLVLQDGITSTADPARGNGYQDLFRGLANHRGRLRFRSGDAAVIIDGQSPSPLRPKVKPRLALNGFIAAVSCLPA